MSSAPRKLLQCLSVTVVLAMSACGKSEEQAPAKAPPPPKETVLDGMISTKARAQQGAEKAMEQNKEKLDAAMKQIDEPAPTP